MNACITQHDWTRWAGMFEDSGFEIYEITTGTYAVAEIHEVIGGPVKHVLEMREVLDDINAKFYELNELMEEERWGPDQKVPLLTKWLDSLRKVTESIRHRGVKQALKELDAEGLFKAEGDDDMVVLDWKSLKQYRSEDEG